MGPAVRAVSYTHLDVYKRQLLDYDVDWNNQELIPAGYSAIRNNHVVLFVEAEHAMGDYVELEFDQVTLSR